VAEQQTKALPKRKFIIELGVGGPNQDVINKLEAAPTYKDMIVKAVRQYDPNREEDSSDSKDT